MKNKKVPAPIKSEPEDWEKKQLQKLEKMMINLSHLSGQIYGQEDWEVVVKGGVIDLWIFIDSLLFQARAEAKYDQRIFLIGLFHGVLKDLYGKEIADMVMSRVNNAYTAVLLEMEDHDNKK